MGDEKLAAFAESWNAMAVQAFRINQALALSCWRLSWMPWTSRRAFAGAGAQMQDAALGILGKGLGPIHRRAVANAKRLARTRFG